MLYAQGADSLAAAQGDLRRAVESVAEVDLVAAVFATLSAAVPAFGAFDKYRPVVGHSGYT